MQIELPSWQQSKVEVKFKSEHASSAWISKQTFLKPEVNLPIKSSSCSVLIPNTIAKLDWDMFLGDGENGLLRLYPKRWWALCNTASVQSDSEVQIVAVDYYKWTLHKLDSNQQNHQCWLVHKTALAALMLSSIILLAAVAFVLAGNSCRKYFLMLAVVIAAILLASDWLVFIFQILLLSICMSGLAKLTAILFQPNRRSIRRSASTQTKVLSAADVIASCLLLVFFGNSAAAQQLDREGPPNLDVEMILIPLDDELEQFDGTHAYVPRKLLRELEQDASSRRKSDAASILEMDYTLRVNPSDPSEDDLIEEFVVQTRLEILSPGQALRLPFRAKELPLSFDDSFVDGVRTIPEDGVLFQDEEGVVFRPSAAGEYQLELTFYPTAELEPQDRARFRTTIPRVPSATLSLLSDSSTNVEIAGVSKKPASPGKQNVLLGPVDNIDCSWYPQKTSVRNSVIYKSYTWVHESEDQLAATATLVVANPGMLQNLFKVTVDEDWEIVGREFGDAELVAIGSRQLQSRNTFELRFVDAARYESTAVIQLVMTPKAGVLDKNEGVQLDFPTIESQPPTEKYFSYFASGKTSWSPTIRGDWIPVELTDEEAERSSIQWSGKIESYQVPNTARNCEILSFPPSNDNSAKEVNLVHLSAATARIEFLAQWPDLRNRDVISLKVPNDSRVISCLFDGSPADYRLVTSQDRERMLVFLNNGGKENSSLQVSLFYPVVTGRSFPLQRVLLDGEEVSSSLFRLLRRAGIECEIKEKQRERDEAEKSEEESETEVALEKVSLRSVDLLSNLETVLGQAELGQTLRENCELPIECELKRKTNALTMPAVLYVTPDADKWAARIEIDSDSSTKPDYIFLRVPNDLVDALRVEQLYDVIPSGDSQRSTIAIKVEEDTTGEVNGEGRWPCVIEFDLSYSLQNNQVEIPDVELLNSKDSHPILALPQRIGEDEIRWKHGLSESVVVESLDNDADAPGGGSESNYEYWQSSGGPVLATWLLAGKQGRKPGLILSNTVIEELQSKELAGYCEFWISPNGNNEAVFNIPRNTTVLGATIGDRFAISRTKDGSLRITLLPNFAPVRIRVHFQAAIEEKAGEIGLQAIEPSNMAVGEAIQLLELRQEGWEVRDPRAVLAPSAIVGEWSELVWAASSSLARLSLKDKENWLRIWHPSHIGFSENSIIQVSFGPSSTTLAEFWKQICSQNEISEPVNLRPTNWNGLSRDRMLESGLRYFEVASPEAVIVRKTAVSTLLPRILFAAGVIAFLAVLYWLGELSSKRFLALLERHPWVYWLQLSAITWLLLPVAWPSAIIALGALIIALGQWIDYRRIAQFQ
ncbi:MAG: hypothetical protein AAF483_10270 [Planctomycetota bacterium]